MFNGMKNNCVRKINTQMCYIKDNQQYLIKIRYINKNMVRISNNTGGGEFIIMSFSVFNLA